MCVALAGAVHAQPTKQAAVAYPTKSIRLIVPFAPGGSNDIMARLTGQKFSEMFGQQVVVDNRAGASGIIGTDIAAKAPPDGYTVLMMSLTFAVNPSLYRKLPYDTEKDLTPVTLVASAPLMLVVHPSIPAKSVKELIAYATNSCTDFAGIDGWTPSMSGAEATSVTGTRSFSVSYGSFL